jgi:hypothetical protein
MRGEKIKKKVKQDKVDAEYLPMLSTRLEQHPSLEKVIIPKAIIGPVVPNISIVPRSLFPWTNSFLPPERIF